MPNRILREAILDSDRVDGLCWAAEVFYRRLMSVVDDYGRFDGRISVIRSKCYPLKLNTVGDPDIGKWLDNCESAGLVRKYTVDGKPYLEVLNFRQQQRSPSKYPEAPHPNGKPPDTPLHSKCYQMVSNDHLVGVGVGDEGGGVGGRAREGVGGPPSFAAQKALSSAEIALYDGEAKRIRTRIRALKNKYADETPKGSDAATFRGLEKRLDELKSKLGFYV